MNLFAPKKRLSLLAFIFLLGLFGIIALFYFYNLIKWGDNISRGWNYRSATGVNIVSSVTESGAKVGLKPNDNILAINGERYRTTEELYDATNQGIDAKNTYLVERDGKKFEVTIVSSPKGFKRVFFRSGTPCLVGLCYVVIGTLVFLMKPHRFTSWSFFLFCTTFGTLLFFLVKGGPLKPSGMGTINILAYVFTPATIVHLTLNFPDRRYLIERYPYIQLCPYLISIVLFATIRLAASQMGDVSKIYFKMIVAYLVLSIFGFMISCLYSWLRSPSEIARVRSKLILLGTLLTASIPLLDTATNAFFHFAIVPGFNYFLPFLIIFPLSIGYTIIKHNLFDIDAVVRRTYGYILATFGIAGMYTFFIFVPTTISGRFELTMSPAYPLVLTIALIFFFNLAHHRIRKFIERVFFRLEYDYQDTVKRISETMASLLSIDQIEKGMMEIASNVLFIDKGFVMLLNQKEQVYEKISGPPSTLKLPARDPLIQKIAEGKRTVTLYDIEEDPLFQKERPACKKTLEQLEATLMVPIIYEDDLIGMMSLGEKKSGRFYRVEDVNLLKTLASQGAVAIENARSFEEIKDLNQALSGKKLQLENTLDELQAAMIKTEILERLKANLYKFVPTTVTKLLEKSPEAVSFGSKEQDLSVMFLDIEGYTTITETLGATAANDIVERYFSVFIDAIYENNGDVMETAGDSLMVLFLSEDKTTNALEAVRSALMIRDKTTLVNQEPGFSSQPLKINIGVSSDQAIVGASKFESYTGARWTYSATGMVVNLAARICAHASGGAVLVSRTTMERVKNHFLCKSIGKFEFKNISEKMELFAIDEKDQN